MSRLALVVDDSLSMRKIVSRTLQGAGFEVVEAANGKEGLDALAARTVNVVITDYNMPVMDGIEFMRGVRETEKDKFTPVIFLTTEIEDAKRDEARAAGATAWIAKPFSPEKILEVINKVVPAP
jgi:two-component system chemotaxis response regulator CheY